MCYLEVTIEDVDFTVKLNFKEIMSQTLVPYKLIIDSIFQPCWEVVDSFRVAIVHKILSKRLHIWITAIICIFKVLDAFDTVTFEFIAEQICPRHTVNAKMIREEFLITSESFRHDVSVVDVLFDE